MSRSSFFLTTTPILILLLLARWVSLAASQQCEEANLVSAGYLFAADTGASLNTASSPLDAKVAEILNRIGPDTKPARDYADFKDIGLNESIRAWELMHHHAQVAISQRVRFAWPVIEQTLREAQVEPQCLLAVNVTLGAAQRLESWALKLASSWGSFPPVGIFEGTYTELGSYHTCVELEGDKAAGGHAHFCNLYMRPVIPSADRYRRFFTKESDQLLKMFSGERRLGNKSMKDGFEDLLDHAHYHHYIYYKLATCWPIACSPFDIMRVARLVARRNVLSMGPVKCHSRHSDDYETPGTVDLLDLSGKPRSSNKGEPFKLKISSWDINKGIYIRKPHWTSTQLVALVILGTILGFIILMTHVDLIAIRLPALISWLQDVLTSKNPSRTNAGRATNQTNGCTTNGFSSLNSSLPLKLAQVDLHEIDLREPTANGDHTKTITHFTPSNDGQETTRMTGQQIRKDRKAQHSNLLFDIANDCSILTSWNDFVDTRPRRNEISCLNGLRGLTMIWIILNHSMMFNEWSGFSRTRKIESQVMSAGNQPLFNGSYLVDTFFLMSGLLSAFNTFNQCQGSLAKFRTINYVLARWLRLTPQILLVSLILMVISNLTHGPFWYVMAGEYSELCQENWWVNALHLQAYFRTDRMCNFPTWWVSIEFSLHIIGIAVVWMFLATGYKTATRSLAGLLLAMIGWQAYSHYQLGLPPNFLSSIPGVAEMWTDMTLTYFWRPYSHAFPFFLGFYLGHLMALKPRVLERAITPKSALIGWTLVVLTLPTLAYSTYPWVLGVISYTRVESTLFAVISPVVWASCMAWIIVACHLGYGGSLNRFLASSGFVLLGKASYMIYLSHFQVLFMIFGSTTILLEPTQTVMSYVIVANTFLSILYGATLHIVFETPWLKMLRRLMRLL